MFLIGILITCHNRRLKTIECLRALHHQQAHLQVRGCEVEGKGANSELIKSAKAIKHGSQASYQFALDLFLTDDGCTDGTADAVRELWPSANILQGDGSLYWCGGMRLAWAEASKQNPDFYLLLNDDTILFPGAVNELLSLVGSPEIPIIGVGSICDPATGAKSYGGTYQNPLPYPPPDGQPRECILFNGNCVLVPRAVFQKIGMFHHAYTHAIGDTDYSYEARRNGIRLLETPCFVGSCARNPVANTWQDTSLPRLRRLKLLDSPKGLPFSEWWVFCRRNCGHEWLRYFLAPTVRILLGR